MPRPARTTAVIVAIAAASVTAACGSSTTGAGAGTTPSSTAPTSAASSASGVSGTVTVLAASSLTEAFNTLAKQFEAANPGTTIKLSFGASSALALQITQGAPADVFASASAKNMKQVTDAKLADSPTNFVKNVMEIAVPPSNPANVTGVADLAKSGVKVALCEAQVPCGATAAKVFTNAKITVKPVTLEADVKSTLAKVESNEVDAGVVYVTDVLSAGSKVKGITIPSDVNASTEYPIAALTKAPNAAAAKAFVAYVLSSAGQSVLTGDGFEQP
ncbi:MAG TPA: molybdate ABC transporter substrate-binding protein [Frankiaceae bacterium]|nr:molybdate ABC transporter substrate-binding protein [Frankiaceae bacterium]